MVHKATCLTLESWLDSADMEGRRGNSRSSRDGCPLLSTRCRPHGGGVELGDALGRLQEILFRLVVGVNDRGGGGEPLVFEQMEEVEGDGLELLDAELMGTPLA